MCKLRFRGGPDEKEAGDADPVRVTQTGAAQSGVHEAPLWDALFHALFSLDLFFRKSLA